MLTTIEGTYCEGKVELHEIPPGIDGARVLVTFLSEEPRGVEQRVESERQPRKFHWDEARRIQDGFTGSVTDELFRQRSED